MRRVFFRMGVVLVVAVIVLTTTAQAAYAQAEWTGACVGGIKNDAGDYDIATIQGISCLLANVLNVVMTILAFVGFVMFVYAAFMLLVSDGQPQKMEKAKSTIVYAVGGLVLAISSFVILNIIRTVTGYVDTGRAGDKPDITEFTFLPNTPD